MKNLVFYKWRIALGLMAGYWLVAAFQVIGAPRTRCDELLNKWDALEVLVWVFALAALAFVAGMEQEH